MNTGQGILTGKDIINHARAAIAVASRTLSDIILKAGSYRMPMRAPVRDLPLSAVPIRVDHQREVKVETLFKGLVVTVSDTLKMIMPG